MGEACQCDVAVPLGTNINKIRGRETNNYFGEQNVVK
jgi:hypothetical protein